MSERSFGTSLGIGCDSTSITASYGKTKPTMPSCRLLRQQRCALAAGLVAGAAATLAVSSLMNFRGLKAAQVNGADEAPAFATLISASSLRTSIPTPTPLMSSVVAAAPTTPISATQLRTAVCVTGQLRTLAMQPDHPHYPDYWAPMLVDSLQTTPRNDVAMTVAESIVRRLYPALGDFDVFVSVGTRSSAREPTVDNVTECEPLRPPSSLASNQPAAAPQLFCDIFREEDLPLYNSPMWQNYYYKDARHQQSLLQQLYGMYRCNAAVARHSRKGGVQYTHMIRTRPDVAMLQPLPPLESFNFRDPNTGHARIFFANNTKCCCGNDDWFGIGEAWAMQQYMDRFLHLQALFHPTLGGWTAESYLHSFLREFVNGTQLVTHPDIAACLVKPKTRMSAGDP